MLTEKKEKRVVHVVYRSDRRRGCAAGRSIVGRYRTVIIIGP